MKQVDFISSFCLYIHDQQRTSIALDNCSFPGNQIVCTSNWYLYNKDYMVNLSTFVCSNMVWKWWEFSFIHI